MEFRVSDFSTDPGRRKKNSCKVSWTLFLVGSVRGIEPLPRRNQAYPGKRECSVIRVWGTKWLSVPKCSELPAE